MAHEDAAPDQAPQDPVDEAATGVLVLVLEEAPSQAPHEPVEEATGVLVEITEPLLYE